jgi:hypothetical protein
MFLTAFTAARHCTELSAVLYNPTLSNVNAVGVVGASSPVTASENMEPSNTFHLSTFHFLNSYFKTETLITMTYTAVYVRCVIIG